MPADQVCDLWEVRSRSRSTSSIFSTLHIACAVGTRHPSSARNPPSCRATNHRSSHQSASVNISQHLLSPLTYHISHFYHCSFTPRSTPETQPSLAKRSGKSFGDDELSVVPDSSSKGTSSFSFSIFMLDPADQKSCTQLSRCVLCHVLRTTEYFHYGLEELKVLPFAFSRLQTAYEA